MPAASGDILRRRLDVSHAIEVAYAVAPRACDNIVWSQQLAPTDARHTVCPWSLSFEQIARHTQPVPSRPPSRYPAPHFRPPRGPPGSGGVDRTAQQPLSSPSAEDLGEGAQARARHRRFTRTVRSAPQLKIDRHPAPTQRSPTKRSMSYRTRAGPCCCLPRGPRAPFRSATVSSSSPAIQCPPRVSTCPPACPRRSCHHLICTGHDGPVSNWRLCGTHRLPKGSVRKNRATGYRRPRRHRRRPRRLSVARSRCAPLNAHGRPRKRLSRPRGSDRSITEMDR